MPCAAWQARRGGDVEKVGGDFELAPRLRRRFAKLALLGVAALIASLESATNRRSVHVGIAS